MSGTASPPPAPIAPRRGAPAPEGDSAPARRGVSRRHFLTGVGLAATAAVAGGYGLSVWDRQGSSRRPVRSAAPASPRLGAGTGGRTLVVFELDGGNDGLNTVVPHADPAYLALRPTLGIKDPIDLDGQIGLHPKLAKLATRYRAGRVAIVEGVGYPDPNLSHFASMATWWSGSTDASSGPGWLGRYLDGTVGFDDPLAAISIGPTPSLALLGDNSFATSISDATGLQPRVPGWVGTANDLVAAWTDFAPADTDPTVLMGRVDDAIHDADLARSTLDSTLDAAHLPSPDAAPGTGSRGATTAGSPVRSAAAIAAALVLAPQPPRIVYLTGLGDYDTHYGEQARHPGLLSDLDDGLDLLLSTLEAKGASDRVLVMTTSEFGRRARENGSGTDHGTASAHFLVGGAVKGGRYGAPASLTALDANGNPKFTTDFRSLYATALGSWLGVDSDAVLAGHYAPLPVFA